MKILKSKFLPTHVAEIVAENQNKISEAAEVFMGKKENPHLSCNLTVCIGAGDKVTVDFTEKFKRPADAKAVFNGQYLRNDDNYTIKTVTLSDEQKTASAKAATAAPKKKAATGVKKKSGKKK